MVIMVLGAALSDVSLDGVRVADTGVVGIQPRLSAGAALVEQIPALIERYLEGLEALTLGLRSFPSALAFPELVLLVGQLVDAVDDWLIPHR
jgi:hypothetical protein